MSFYNQRSLGRGVYARRQSGRRDATFRSMVGPLMLLRSGAAAQIGGNGSDGALEPMMSMTLDTSMRPGGDFEWRVATENCYLVDHNNRLRVATLDDGQIRDISLADQGSRYDQFCPDTLERLQSGRPPIATLYDCYRAMQVIDAIYDKAVRTPCAQR